MELTYGCNANCDNIDDKMEPGAVLTLGGLVTDAVTKSTKRGQPYGRASVEDFNGRHEFVFFGRDYESIFQRFKVGQPVFIKGQVQSKPFNPAELELKVTDVSSLDGIKGNVANTLMIFLDRNVVDNELFDYLSSLESKSEGRTGELYLNLYDKERQQSIKIHSRKRIPLEKSVLDRLDSMSVKYKVMTEDR